MSFKTDNGGVAIKLSDVKLMSSVSTWATRLSQIGKTKGEIIICTYSLPNIEYVKNIFNKRSDITIIAHKKFTEKANLLKNFYPKLRIFLKNNVHAKLALIEPKTVWLTSANFGHSNWVEHAIGFHDENVYKFYKDFLSCSFHIKF